MAVNTEVKTYQAFRGVDYSASPAVISDEHASDMLNMYIGEDGVMQKRPGWHILNTFLNVHTFSPTVTYHVGEYVKYNGVFYECTTEHTGAWNAEHFEVGTPPRLPINGLHYVQYRQGMGMLFVHAGDRLYGTMFLTGASGDVNQDGVITVSDASMILRYLAGLQDLTPVQQALADVNGDGRITEDDAAQLLRRIAGLEPFPDGKSGILASSYFRVTYKDGTMLTLNNDYSLSFEHDQMLYILDGERYVRLVPEKESTQQIVAGKAIKLDYINSVYAEVVEGYIPTTGVNGHYEYNEPKTETTTGTDVVEKATVTLGNGDSSAQFTALESIDGKRIFVSVILNSHSIANGLLVEVEKMPEIPTFAAEESYAVGDYVKHEGTVYKCTTAHTGAWNASDFTEISDFSSEQTYEVGALVKRSGIVYKCIVRHTGTWTAAHFTEAEPDPSFDIGYLHFVYTSGMITVTSNAVPLTKGDKVTLFIKNEDEEVDVSGEPGSETNPGEWKKPETDEDRNLLTAKQINTFTTDGIHKAFYLTDNGCEIVKVEVHKWTRCKSVNGKDVPTQENIDHVDAGTYNGIYYYYRDIWTEVEANDADYGWTVRNASSTTAIQNDISYTTRIAFNKWRGASRDGTPNVRVTFIPQKHASEWAVNKDRGYIEKCTIMTRFGYFNNNRIWLSGNPEHRSMDFMSAIDDPTYFPNTCWTKIGSDLTAIQGYLHYGSELAIIKEDNNQDATVYMRSAVLTEDNNVIFPVQQGAQGVGAVSKYCLKTLKDEPLFLAKEGVYAIQGTNASQERTIPNRSYYIDKKLKAEIDRSCVAEVFGDYYIVCNPSTGHAFVADARYQGLPPGTNDRSRVYEWYVWDNIPARVMLATDDYLFFGTIDGRLCAFNFDWDNPKRYTDGAEFVDGSTVLHKWHPYDGGYEIKSYYVTKADHLDALDFKKTMLIDGGVVALKPYEQSSAAISVMTDKGAWFIDHIQTDADDPSVVVPIRKRFKNFDWIQTRIENKEIREGFAILGLQYRYVITTNRR